MNYTPTQWNTAEDKALFVKQMMRFIKKGFPQELFYKTTYVRLSMCFGHIAHYNQFGFYETWFREHASRAQWLKQVQQWGCYGDPSYTYSDAEREIQRQVKEFLREGK